MVNGGDVSVKLGISEATERLLEAGPDGFVELPGEDGPIHVRPSAVIAIIEDARKKTAGFRVTG
jgi:hypothetical protein